MQSSSNYYNEFGEEIKSLKVDSEITKSSKILQFSTFLDEEGIIRAKNRIGSNKEGIEEHLPQQGIRWKFNPPAAPHFGGVWERLVRSCKKAMIIVLGNRSVTKDVLSTTMCFVEYILNASPLTPVSSDVNDREALTHNHFLLGNTNVCLPYLPCAEEFVDHRKLFLQTQAYANLIWYRFRKEYLPTLNNRQKWRSTANENENRTEGNFVWLIEDSDNRRFYNLVRVMETEFRRDQWWSSLCYQTVKMFHDGNQARLWRPSFNNFLKHSFH